MKKHLLIITLLLSLAINAQKEKINLPKSNGFTVKYSNSGITPLLSVYINKKGEVYLEDVRLSIEHLGDSLFKYKEKILPHLKPFVITLIHADKHTPYINVEKVKSQMSRALLIKGVYRTGHINDINSGLTARINEKSLVPSRKTLEKDTSKDTIFNNIVIEDPIGEIVRDLYSLNFSKAKKKLKSNIYKKVTFYNDKKLKINGKKYKLKNKEGIYKALKKTNFILVFSDPNMKYKTYLKNLSLLTKVYEANKKPTIFIEISNDLQKILKQQKVKI